MSISLSLSPLVQNPPTKDTVFRDDAFWDTVGLFGIFFFYIFFKIETV